MTNIIVATLNGSSEIGVTDVPGRKQKALYVVRDGRMSVLAYFNSNDCAEYFQETLDWIAAEYSNYTKQDQK